MLQGQTAYIFIVISVSSKNWWSTSKMGSRKWVSREQWVAHLCWRQWWLSPTRLSRQRYIDLSLIHCFPQKVTKEHTCGCYNGYKINSFRCWNENKAFQQVTRVKFQNTHAHRNTWLYDFTFSKKMLINLKN